MVSSAGAGEEEGTWGRAWSCMICQLNLGFGTSHALAGQEVADSSSVLGVEGEVSTKTLMRGSRKAG